METLPFKKWLGLGNDYILSGWWGERQVIRREKA